ncbi:MAG TPA: CHAD domain-containing protein [Acidimicrobiales bacterium]|nr:CHAD domain-containing protein [Acidimicrobiales bacterium]
MAADDDTGTGADEIEVEWQFDALDLRPVERWLAGLPLFTTEALSPLTAQAKPPRRLADRYLDTEDWRMGRAGLVLRTRRRGRREEATLKDLGPAGPGGLRERLEVSEDLPEGGLDQLGPDGPVGWRLRAVAGRRPLRQVLEVRTRRRPFSLRVGGDEIAELALDETVVDVGPDQPPVRLRRVEVEAVPRWVRALEPLVRDLQANCGLQPATLSKFEAGLLALGAEIPGPPDLGPTDVSGRSTFGELAFAVVRRHLGVLLAKEPGTRLGEDIEELHDMRVATRRLRAALDLFVTALPVRVTALRDELRWLAAVLGAVRDLDVQIDTMDRTEEPAAAGDLDHLRRLLEEERQAARTAMLEALDSPRWERLAAGLVALAQQGPNRRSAGARQPATLAVPPLVLDRHRAVVKAARKARRSGVPADFHRLRIRCKRLRYSLEFVGGVYGGRTDRFTRRLAKVQDALGLMQDAEVAGQRLHDLAVGNDLPPATVFAMGGVAERYRRQAAELLATMPGHLKVLGGKEWDDLAAHMERARAGAQAALPPAPPLEVVQVVPTPQEPARPAAPAPSSASAPSAAPAPPPPADPADDQASEVVDAEVVGAEVMREEVVGAEVVPWPQTHPQG